MTLKKNITSQSILKTIKKKLQGKCTECGGTLPNHIGICPVWGEEIERKYNIIDNKVKHISTIIDKTIVNYYGGEQDV